MKKILILIATDFSDAAYNAAKYGTDMALAISTDILLLHVYQAPLPVYGVPVITDEDIRNDAEIRMNRLKDDLMRKSGNKVNIETEIRMGSFYHELKMACCQALPFIVILGSQGKTAAKRLTFGSEAVYTMKHLTWPVITVPAVAKFSNIKKVGLACDFDHAIGVLRVDEINRFVTVFNAELHVLNTGAETDFNPNVVFESGMLRGMLKKLNPTYHFITNGNIDDRIIEFTEENDLDLLIVLPKRHSLVEKLFHRSHTKQFVLHSHIPVMALHL